MLIQHGSVVLPTGVKENCDIRIQDNKIADIGKLSPKDEPIVNANGFYVCPGFVDIHTHGGGGGDFMDAEQNSFEQALSFHSRYGTTALLATSVTAPPEQIVDMLSLVRQYQKVKNPQCRVLGAHIEGPYLSLKNKGAQHERFLRIPARDSYDFILKNKDVVKTVTIAPELDGAITMTKALREVGIVVCGGHDDGYKDIILPVIEAGLTHCTHLWCAMSTVAMRNGVRSVGLCELGLVDDRLTVEIIADNHHITPEMVKLIYKCKGAEQMCIVSDSLRAGGMPSDESLYILGSKSDCDAQKFIVADGAARLPDRSRLAGSIQPLSQMVKNLVFDAGIDLYEAVAMASLTPAKIIGADHQLGSIQEGKLADICILDKNLQVKAVMVNGVFIRKEL